MYNAWFCLQTMAGGDLADYLKFLCRQKQDDLTYPYLKKFRCLNWLRELSLKLCSIFSSLHIFRLSRVNT
jgi:hypothetical protein